MALRPAPYRGLRSWAAATAISLLCRLKMAASCGASTPGATSTRSIRYPRTAAPSGLRARLSPMAWCMSARDNPCWAHNRAMCCWRSARNSASHKLGDRRHACETVRIMYLASRDRLAMISRRQFLHATVAIGGGLALAVRLPAQETGEAAEAGEAGAISTAVTSSVRTPAAFVQIAADDTITIITPAVEMGQGGHTSMPMMIMEELGGDWQRLRVTDAAAAAIYNNPMFGQQSTVGSFSVRGWFMDLRRIGAAAREMLVQAAAAAWRGPATECTVAQSKIVHASSGRTRTFGSVAAKAAQLPVPRQPVLKNVADFKLIGSSPPRVDVPIKVDGSARYGIDMVLPGMLYAAVKTCPTFGGTLKSHDDSAARKLSGYHSTVILPDGVI